MMFGPASFYEESRMPRLYRKRTTPAVSEQWRIAASMWGNGHDTWSIAQYLRLPESEVYNGLARLKERIRRAA